MTTDTFTRGTSTGGNQLARIYDRLRKRSLRADRAIDALAHQSFSIEDVEAWEGNMRLMDAVERQTWGTVSPTVHEAYVRGVRDALAAVEREAI